MGTRSTRLIGDASVVVEDTVVLLVPVDVLAVVGAGVATGVDERSMFKPSS
jgi:hypothetical protein